MSEEYIRIHKPAYLNSQATPKTPRNSRRKSVSHSAKKNKKQQVLIRQEETDILNEVFNIFDEKIKKTKQEIHQDLFESIYDNILQYFDYYAFKRAICTSTNSDIMFNPVCNVIPTIALFTGINTQDYAYLCDNLSDKLKDNFTPNLFFINEKNSNNIKTLVNSIFAQWESTIEDEEKLVKRNVFTLRYLFDLIKSETQSDARSGSVIFFFKHFELIPRETIECFVSLISCHMESLPIYFIIELASQTNIIQEQLSSNVISKLCIKKLYLMSPNQYIDKFVRKLFIDETMLFKISGDIFKYLMDVYHDYSFSISTFIHALRAYDDVTSNIKELMIEAWGKEEKLLHLFCYFDHLQQSDLNALFVNFELDDINLFESLMQRVNKNDVNKGLIKSICCNLNENSTSICVQQVQKKWQQFNNQFVLMCDLLYEIVKHFPSEQDENSLFSNNTKSFIDLYVKMCNFSCNKNKTRKFCESEQFLNLKKLLHLSSMNTVNEIVTSFLRLIKTKAFNNESSYNGEFLNDIHDFYELLDKMKKSFTIQNCDTSFNEEDDLNVQTSPQIEDIYDIDSKINQLEFLADESPKLKSIVSRKSSVRTLKAISENSPSKHKRQSQSLLTQQQKKTQTTKVLNQFKQCMIEWLTSQFTIYFDADYSHDIPFSNYFCYSNLDRLKKRIFDVQRMNMHECLLNSFEYLRLHDLMPEQVLDESPRKKMKNTRKSACLSPPVKKIDLDSALIPLNIAYKLYLECGHMINLHDWLQAFVDRIENVGLDDLKESKKKQLIALFFRTITELQFMGYIKPTSRKVDHVIKLTNGSGLLVCE